MAAFYFSAFPGRGADVCKNPECDSVEGIGQLQQQERDPVPSQSQEATDRLKEPVFENGFNKYQGQCRSYHTSPFCRYDRRKRKKCKMKGKDEYCQ